MNDLLRRFAAGRARTDGVFSLVRPEALRARPIPLRHRFIFYLGHVDAFDWNLLGRALDVPRFDAAWDRLFAFGIDPISGNVPDDRAADWPAAGAVRRYAARLRRDLDAALRRLVRRRDAARRRDVGRLLHVAMEHRMMHAETLAYMLNRMPLEALRRPRVASAPRASGLRPVPRTVEIPAGTAMLGRTPDGDGFGWDNEFAAHTVQVPAFAIDVYNVTNAQYLDFMRAGGYEDRALWSREGWEWKEREGVAQPAFWRGGNGSWRWRTTFGEIPLPHDWPVYVSHAEASAYARWRRAALPTEAEWQRAAHGAPGRDGTATGAAPARGNVGFARWDPVAVGSDPAAVSAFGVADLCGNGWEWTSTLFQPFPGFRPFPFYPGYSAEFFDGRHFVLKGGAARTARCLLRPSFRNWFQPHYPHLHASFRCVTR